MSVCDWARLIFAVSIAPTMATANGQDFPSKTLRFLVPFPAGGSFDLIARILATPVGKSLGQTVVVENRPGANTVIAQELTIRAPADGHVLLTIGPSFTITPFVRSNLTFDPAKDFSGVTRTVSLPMIIAANPALPVRSIKDVIRLARAQPGELTYGTASIIGQQRVAAELFKEAAKIDIVNVPYNGAVFAATAVIGGHTSMLLVNVADIAPQLAAGKLRPIAVTTASRVESLKDVPTIAESGFPGFEITNWSGMVVRSATPRAAITRLNVEIARAFQQNEVVEALAKLGLSPAPMNAEAFDALIQSEMRNNGNVVKRLGVRID